MEYKYECLFNEDYIKTSILTAICFFTPILLGHSQILTGIIINIILVLAAYKIKGYALLPIIITPSIGAVSAGLLLGELNFLIIYFMPIIWLGNLVFVNSHANKKELIAPFLKSLILFVPAVIFYLTGLVPAAFVIAMGPMQLLTSIIGGILANPIKRLL